MLKTKEYHICDRCKKEIEKEKINFAPYHRWCYELCDECNKDFLKFKNEVEDVEKYWETLEKEYQFGEYLPQEIEKVE